MARLPPMDGITTTLCPPTPFSSPAPSPPFLQRLWSFSEVADSWTRYGKVRANLLAIERCQANAINHVIGSTSVSSWYRWCADFEEAIDHMVAICATNLTTLAIYIDLNCLVSSVFRAPSLPPLTSSESTVWLTDALVGTAPSSAATPAMTQSLATPSELCVESSGSAWPFPPSPSDPPRETGIGLEDWSNRSTSISERTYGSVGSSATSQNAGPSDDVCAKLGAIEGNKTSPSLPAPARPPLARANRSKKTSSSRSTSSRACARLKQTKANATEIESINLSADARRALQNREKSKRYNQRVQEQRGALESFVTYLLNHHHRHQIQAREDQSQQRKPTSSEQSLRRVVAMLQDDSRTGEDGPISEEAQETRKHDKHARKNSNSAQYQQLAAAAAAQTSIVASNVRKRQSKQRLRMDELRRFYAVQCMAEHLLLVGAAEKVSSESDGARPVGPSQSRKRVDSQSKASKPWTDRVFGSDASLRLMLEVFMSNKALWYHLIEAEKRQLSELSRRFPDSKVIIQYDAKAMDGDEVVVVVDQGEQKHQHPICSLVELLESQ
ncbi:hypothetical protein OC845_005619 [Tilletia horrida]|nr:hypothetical protein OC845_005619 [Tilletia horrida]